MDFFRKKKKKTVTPLLSISVEIQGGKEKV